MRGFYIIRRARRERVNNNNNKNNKTLILFAMSPYSFNEPKFTSAQKEKKKKEKKKEKTIGKTPKFTVHNPLSHCFSAPAAFIVYSVATMPLFF